MKCYILSPDLIRTAWIDDTERYPGDVVHNCATCGVRGVSSLPPNRRPHVGICVTRPGTLDDFMSPGGSISFSHKAQQACRKAKLKGIRFVSPAEVVCAKVGPRFEATRRVIVETLRCKIAWIYGNGGSIAKTSSARVVWTCPKCGWEECTLPTRGFTIDPRQWDGSDFFFVREYPPVLISQRAHEVLIAAGLTNYDCRDSTKWRPGYYRPHRFGVRM